MAISHADTKSILMNKTHAVGYSLRMLSMYGGSPKNVYAQYLFYNYIYQYDIYRQDTHGASHETKNTSISPEALQRGEGGEYGSKLDFDLVRVLESFVTPSAQWTRDYHPFALENGVCWRVWRSSWWIDWLFW
jgi:hypothetical protein